MPRRSAVRFHEGAFTRAGEKIRRNERAQQFVADGAIEAPQALRLRGCQTESWHFAELSLDPLKHVLDTHGFPSAATRNWCCNAFLEQHVYRLRNSPLRRARDPRNYRCDWTLIDELRGELRRETP